MRKESTGSRSESRPEWEQLEDWVRSQVQRLIQELLEEEVTEFLGRAKSALRSDSDSDTGYRNGYGRARRLTLSSGTIQLRRPRVRDTEEQFESRLLPLFVNRTRKIAELIPELYLHGLSEGDFDLALRGLPGEDAPVSASTVARLKSKWNDELAQWRSRPLDDLEVVYMWVDGVYVKAGLEKEKAAVLVVMAALSDGSKVVVSTVPGYRESTESWSEVLRDIKRRGLSCPRLVVGDGHLGIWGALRNVYPQASSWKHAPQIMIPGYRTPGPQMPHRPPKETADASEKSEKYAVLRAQVMNWGALRNVYPQASSWKHAPQIMIPGYRTPGPQMPHRPPKETADASEKSEKYAVLRAQVMNVHQSCLATSERLIKRRSSQMGLPLTAADTLKGLTFGACIAYRDSIDAQTLVRNALNNKDGIIRQHPFLRHVLEIEVIAHSLDLLDQILLAEGTDLIQMIEAAYMAACRCAEGRFGEAVTLAWGVCEQLLSTAWETLLNDTRDAGRMPARRRKKLKDRDYTASVITEMLELGMRIDHDLYRHLEEARKSRNQWTHDMCEPSIGQVRDAIRAVEGLFRQTKGIHLSFQLSGPSPGVPGWNIWIWEASKGSGGS